MRRWIVVFSIAVLCAAEFEPEPIDEKPVVGVAEKWDLTGRYYNKVTMPDGSKVELKSKTSLTKAQWQKLAEDYQKAIEAIPEPEVCPTCGQLKPY
jgi:hypothetical protein